MPRWRHSGAIKVQFNYAGRGILQIRGEGRFIYKDMAVKFTY